MSFDYEMRQENLFPPSSTGNVFLHIEESWALVMRMLLEINLKEGIDQFTNIFKLYA